MPPLTVASSFGNMSPQVAKMMEQLSKGYFGFLPNEVWTPNVNLYETAHDYLVCVDLSGVDKDKIEASFKKGVLTVTLPKTPEAQKSEKKITVKAA